MSVAMSEQVTGNYIQLWIVGVGPIIHRQVAADQEADSPPVEITFDSINGGKGISIPLTAVEGETVYLQAEQIDPATGLASNPSVTIQAVIKAVTP
jgi:hypothetical protein